MKGTDEVADQETKKSLKDPDYNSEEESNEVLKEYHLTQKKYAEVVEYWESTPSRRKKNKYNFLFLNFV